MDFNELSETEQEKRLQGAPPSETFHGISTIIRF